MLDEDDYFNILFTSCDLTDAPVMSESPLSGKAGHQLDKLTNPQYLSRLHPLLGIPLVSEALLRLYLS